MSELLLIASNNGFFLKVSHSLKQPAITFALESKKNKIRMKTSERFKEYIWLIDLLKTYGGITFEEINEEWVQTEMSGGVEMARSTFNRHKDAIEDMFGVYIECDRSNGYKYYIGNERVLEEDTIQTWMLSTLSIGNKIHENKSLYGRVLLEGAPENDCLLETR